MDTVTYGTVSYPFIEEGESIFMEKEKILHLRWKHIVIKYGEKEESRCWASKGWEAPVICLFALELYSFPLCSAMYYKGPGSPLTYTSQTIFPIGFQWDTAKGGIGETGRPEDGKKQLSRLFLTACWRQQCCTSIPAGEVPALTGAAHLQQI